MFLDVKKKRFLFFCVELLFEIVLVSFTCPIVFDLFQVDSVVLGGCRMRFLLCFCFFVVVGCCSLFRLFCRVQVVSGCFVSSGWFKLF